MAGKAIKPSLPICIYGLHSLQSPGRRQNTKPGSLCGSGVNTDGYKEILSITVGANETSKFWLGVINDLKNRGVQNVLFFSADGLPSFKEAFQAVDPQTQIQRCVVHMLRNSFKYINYNDLKKFTLDFKAVYKAPTESAAQLEMEGIKEKWGKKYPYAISNWENNWEDVNSFFQFPEDIRGN